VLDQKRLQGNRQWMEAEAARLRMELSGLGVSMDDRERPGYGTHMADNASEVFEQAKNLAVTQSLRRTLEMVVRALDKMERGGYGLCEGCGNLIDPARLKALPYAAFCMSCQSRAELATTSKSR